METLTPRQRLFNHMAQDHGVTLLESEMHEIEIIVADILADDRRLETGRRSSSELACSEWMDALAENLRAEADKCMELGTKHHALQYDVAYVVLDRIATAVERTGISASIGGLSDERQAP